MRVYIFLTFSLTDVGGGQCYLAAKAKYLETCGWKTIILSATNNKRKKCPIDYLNQFLPFSIQELRHQVYDLHPLLVDYGLKKMIRLIGKTNSDDDIIIETHTDIAALWGELLAKRLKARHMYFALYEHYRNPQQNFLKKIDFYKFKMDRGELMCSYRTANRLFDGFRTYSEKEVERALTDEAPIQSVINPQVESLKRYDYNICYIGRTQKSYVPHIIRGIGEFSANHHDKQVQFVIVGQSELQRALIDKVIEENENLIITEVGSLHPLPRALYSKIDVVIAGSGSARCSVEEGAVVIIADTESDKSLGLLGYDTNDSIFRAKDSVIASYCEALERVLVRQEHKSMTYKYPPKMGVAECTAQNFELISKADKKLVYYDEDKIREGKLNLKANLLLIKSKMRK